MIFRLFTPRDRYNAKRAIDDAPDGWRVSVAEPTRSNAQNDHMWALIDDIIRAKPEERDMPKDSWKGLFMHACGHKQIFEPALEGDVLVSLGFKSSYLTVSEMSDLIEMIYAYGAQHGVVWSAPKWRDAA